MRYISRVLIAVAMLASTSLSAQEHKRVEVTKNYTHEVSPATKIVAPTTIVDAPVIEPEIKYNVNPETWQVELDDRNFNPALASYWDFNHAERLFAQLAVGYPLVSDLAVRYAIHNVRLGYFGVGVEHDGNFYKRSNALGVEQTIANSYSMSNRVNVGGGIMAGKQMFEASVDYDNSIINRYATLTTPDRLYFHDANLNLRYGDDFADLSRLNFAVEADGGIWSSCIPSTESFSVSEYNANVGINLARDFKGNVVGVNAGFGLWQSDKEAQYRDMAINMGVSYARSFGIMGFEAEIGYMYDKVSGRAKPSHFLLPAAKISFDFGKVGIMPFIELKTNITHNNLEAMYEANPYIDYIPMQGAFGSMASTRSYDLHFGIMGSDRASKVAYRVYLGGNFMRDQMLWYINREGTFGFTQQDNNRLFVGAEFEYRPLRGFQLVASARAHSDNTSSEYAVSDARLVAAIKAEYDIKRWNFGVGCDYTGVRRWSGEMDGEGIVPVVFTAPAYFNLKANIAFKVSNTIEAYINGYNLLNQQIFDYAHYADRGLSFMVGVKMDF